MSGVGGTNRGPYYYVLTSSNLLAPLSLRTSIATNHFDGTGHFIFTNAAQTSAAQQYCNIICCNCRDCRTGLGAH